MLTLYIKPLSDWSVCSMYFALQFNIKHLLLFMKIQFSKLNYFRLGVHKLGQKGHL